jgi:murein DD-endopeptidase MepM/ murein hydrolase activator NlpD
VSLEVCKEPTRDSDRMSGLLTASTTSCSGTLIGCPDLRSPKGTRVPIAAALATAALLLSFCVLLSTAPAGADTSSDLSDARQKVAAAQDEANAAAAEFSDAEGRFEELEGRIRDLETVIEASQARAATLEEIVRQRAVAAYQHRDTSELDVMISADNPLDAARRATLLDRANQTDNLSVKKLAALRSELSRQQKQVQEQRDEQQKVKERLDAKIQSVQASLAAASKARDDLATRLEKEQADAAAAAELARIRAIQAASAAASQASNSASGDSGNSGGSPGQVIANPGGGAFQCPVSGSAYSDNYGPRGDGFHYGIDMLAPMGVPEVAVKAGTVSYMAMDGAGGNEAYLAADDGNVYYYAHMSQFVGGARSVAQGEVIGLVGSTGSSTAPHLHFEIRIGGANGQRIDPYATLRAAGC